MQDLPIADLPATITAAPRDANTLSRDGVRNVPRALQATAS
jgi:hypothetical protein